MTSSYSLDDLFVLAEETPFIEELNKQLHRNFGSQLAHQWLMRRGITLLLQDVGTQIDREINGHDPAAPAPGPETARLNAEYQPVTQKRVQDIMQNTYACLMESRLGAEEKSETQRHLQEVMTKLNVPLPSSPVQQPKSKKQPKP